MLHPVPFALSVGRTLQCRSGARSFTFAMISSVLFPPGGADSDVALRNRRPGGSFYFEKGRVSDLSPAMHTEAAGFSNSRWDPGKDGSTRLCRASTRAGILAGAGAVSWNDAAPSKLR
jgi:hypothetical protein